MNNREDLPGIMLCLHVAETFAAHGVQCFAPAFPGPDFKERDIQAPSIMFTEAVNFANHVVDARGNFIETKHLWRCEAHVVPGRDRPPVEAMELRDRLAAYLTDLVHPFAGDFYACKFDAVNRLYYTRWWRELVWDYHDGWAEVECPALRIAIVKAMIESKPEPDELNLDDLFRALGTSRAKERDPSLTDVFPEAAGRSRTRHS